ncbi:hypothetical protein EO95_03875 [Methanosarcina sp. 1.H.T.1A.1]|uniref:hypothetical protein n=1 Tax=Methanosarcina sp. 1.H.T.1A.1 TaxID=1483602 RepID=UPI000621A633|nr:hypothetical protein [Methanosarcina sp. 1.H.T.1A.1]KKH96895.1 hypothetical protein EO95_03875 [Methanosarcina sp. 1.H.T.1A.1]
MDLFRKKHLVLAVIMLVATIGIAYAPGSQPDWAPGGPPDSTPGGLPDSTPACAYSSFCTLDGFDKVVVFMAAGQYNASLPPAEGDLAVWYHKAIMGRNDTEIQAEKEAAMKYFEDEFGPGLPEPVAFGVDPRNEYRAYIISCENIPPEGWVVRDGGFIVNFPKKTKLYGNWGGSEGKNVPAGSFIVYGDYNIKTTLSDECKNYCDEYKNYCDECKNYCDKKTSPLIIHYQSAEPIIPDTINNGITFRCTTIAPWGEGIAQGISYTQTLENGNVQANIRNVHTYPAFGPSVVHDM